MKIKVCGITAMEQIDALEAMRADFAGLIFYPASPRCVLHAAIHPEALQQRKRSIKLVGVFVNEEPMRVLSQSVQWGLDLVQLHGEETPDDCKLIRQKLPVVKAFRVGPDADLEKMTEPYSDVVDYFLFDTLGKQHGGTGEQFDWSLVSGKAMKKNFFLSGGIGPDDLEKTRTFAEKVKQLFSLDVNSKFETMPGVKDMEKLKEFIVDLKKTK